MDYALFVDSGDIAVSAPKWSLLRNFGEPHPDPLPVAMPRYNRHSSVMLYSSTGPLEIRAVAGGNLKVDFLHPYGGGEGFNPDHITVENIPERISLILKIHPFKGMGASLDVSTNKVAGYQVIGYRYEEVDTASLQVYLLDKLRESAFPKQSLEKYPDEDLFKMFIAGELEAKVEAGEAFGKSGEFDSNYFIDFSVHTDQGPIHPSFFYEEVRDKVTDGTAYVDDLLAIAPNNWPLVSATATVGDAIAASSTKIYPWSVWLQAKSDIGIDFADWYTIKENQKQLFEAQLKERTGQSSGGAEYFQFDDNDRMNLFMLEAVTEYFLNYDEPWDSTLSPKPIPWSEPDLTGTGATIAGAAVMFSSPISISYLRKMHHWIYIAEDEARPSKMYRIMGIDPSGTFVLIDYPPSLAGGGSTSDWKIDVRFKVNWLDPEGTAASVAPATAPAGKTVIQLDGETDFSEVKANYDIITIEEADESTHGTKSFLITAYDPESNQVTVDKVLTFSGSSDWRITTSPKFVIVDPLGPRLSGSGAVPGPSQVDLPDNPPMNLEHVSPEFDHIYLEEETSPRKTFRIYSRIEPSNVTYLNGTPSLAASSSAWGIPAGIGGSQNNVKSIYVAPGNYDNYDGMLFLVHNNEIKATFPWSSYSSRKYIGVEEGSSIKGNRRYDVRSYVSGKEKLHYCFKVEDPFSDYDGVLEAPKYFQSPPVPMDTTNGPTGNEGKTEIRIHWGYKDNSTNCNGSAGCLVSPTFLVMRNLLLDIHNAGYQKRTGKKTDPEVTLLTNVTQARNDEIYAWWNPRLDLDGVTWEDKLWSRLYLIRPDELPHIP